MKRILIVTLIFIQFLFALSSGSIAEEIILYDSSEGNLPYAQGWIFGLYPLPPFGTNESVQQFDITGKYTRLDTTANISDMAGYFSSVPPPISSSHPDIPESLDLNQGFMLSFSMQMISESHNNQDRAGFSVIVTSNEYDKAIELGFWENEIWAQEGGTDNLFTHAEGTSFDTTSQFNDYDLLIYGDVYELYANSNQILNGKLRDYSAFSGSPPFDYPYTTSRFLFLGDDTSSAKAEVYLQSIRLSLPILGNIDKNEKVGLEDAIILLKILVGTDLGEMEVSRLADVNQDHTLGLEEVVYILQYISDIR